ncbi:response regulator [Sinorhizobium sp. RAC02]|uniref:response regulator n=1 Tax=Sinorhizobium sp. RAC02 TaxID=1842534 RepID=UPI00083DFB0F|nr:response regulator [Sinorhizobium sp. RAC02]
MIASHLETIVEEQGHERLGPAATVEQALAHAPRADVAFVDVGLSDGNNGQLLARRLVDRFGIEVIFVTGDPGTLQNGFDGARAVIRKPFREEDIISALTAALDRRQRMVGKARLPQ